ncbi:MAG: HDIG domain-containing protein, partial [Deltaproteobacteria bacterium]|nr:HDIG domain-containing protein [Deltaproteobacteria bacterium]
MKNVTGVKSLLGETIKEYSLKGVSPLKAGLLLAVSLFVAVFFLPLHTLYTYDYSVGDVATVDIQSPVEITTEFMSVKKGEIVIRKGEKVTPELSEKFDAINTVLKDEGTGRFFIPAAGLFIFTFILLTVNAVFARTNIRKFSDLPRDMLFMAVVFLSTLLVLRFSGSVSIVTQSIFPFIPSALFVYMIPVAAGVMLVRLFLNSETALIFAAVLSIMAGFFLGSSLEFAAYFFVGSVVATMGVRQATQRSTIMKAGVHVAIVNSVVLLSIAAIKGGSGIGEPFMLIFAGCVNGIVTAIIVVGVTPLLEMIFGYTTNIRLLELSRMDHPLLKELAVKAPGTYHHSIVIGTLVEAAAEAIHANPLLARVSSYYHDIGKMKMPLYFIENMSGENRHDKLQPSMSALILTNHVREGSELAKSHRLGKDIVDVIEQHHGTSLIKYFYQKAKEAGEGEVVNEKDFCYPGPKPQTKEAGLVMLADAIEAASKTLPDPTPVKIQGLTQTIVNRIFIDGQLDECELTLKDLHSITSSFNHVLAGIYHSRIEYPEPVIPTKEEQTEGSDTSDGEAESGGGDKPEPRKKNGRGGIK